MSTRLTLSAVCAATALFFAADAGAQSTPPKADKPAAAEATATATDAAADASSEPPKQN